MTKVLVTGALGFIGSHICKALVRDGYSVIAADIWSHGGGSHGGERWRNLRTTPVRWVTIGAIPEKFDIAIHCGWLADTTATLDGFGWQLQIGTELIETCEMIDAHLVFVSSAAIYGKHSPSRDGKPQKWSPDPLNAYAWSKLQMEFEVRARLGCRSTIVRPFNVYGPNEYHKGAMASLAFQIHLKMMQGQHIKLFKSLEPTVADGDQKRDHVYVADVAAAIVKLATFRVPGDFDIGTGQARTFNDLARICCQLGDYQGEISYKGVPREIAENYQSYTEADTQALRDANLDLYFRPIEEGLATYYNEFLLPGWRYFE